MFGRTNGPVVELIPSTSCSTTMVSGSVVPWIAIVRVALVPQRAGPPERGNEAHDRVPALHPGRDARPDERELVDGVGRVHAAHVRGGPGDRGLAHALQDLERAGRGQECHRVTSVAK